MSMLQRLIDRHGEEGARDIIRRNRMHSLAVKASMLRLTEQDAQRQIDAFAINLAREAAAGFTRD